MTPFGSPEMVQPERGPVWGEALLKVCQDLFPSRSDLRISTLHQINDGWECDVYAFALESSEPEAAREELILRVYQGREAEVKALREVGVMRRLHDTGYPVPAILALETKRTAGNPWVVMERIDGASMGELMRRASEGERDAILSRFCRLFADLHALDWRPFVVDSDGYLAVDPIDRWLASASTVVAEFGAAEFESVLAWLRDHQKEAGPVRLAVTHGDFHPWNILVQGDGAAFVIDWTTAEVTDLRFDLGWTLLLAVTSFGPEMRDRVLTEYEGIVGHPLDGIEYFEVIAATRRLGDILVSLQHGAEAMGMRPGAEALMTDGARHVRTAYGVLTNRSGLRLPAVEEMLAGLD